MASYRIYRLRENQQQSFRWAPHTIGASEVKPKDYQEGERVEGASFYSVWYTLRGSKGELKIGDVLEAENGELRICKYVGFESAHWVLPEVKAAPPEEAPGQDLSGLPASGQPG